MKKTFPFWIFVFLTNQSFVWALETSTNWKKSGESHIAHIEIEESKLLVFSEPLCTSDNFNNEICLDYGWRNSCLEIYFLFGLSDETPYVFSDEEFPILKIDRIFRLDINKDIQADKKGGSFVPRYVTDRALFYRTEIGTPGDLKNSPGTFVQGLLKGDELKIFFPVLKGPVMRSIVSLKNLSPLLLSVLEKAEAMKPEGQCPG